MTLAPRTTLLFALAMSSSAVACGSCAKSPESRPGDESSGGTDVASNGSGTTTGDTTNAAGSGSGGAPTMGTGGVFSGGAGSGAVVDAADPAIKNRLSAIRARLATLSTEAMTFWKKKGPDPTNGGFYGNLDRMGNKSSPTDKGLIQEARHLWAFTNWYAMKEPTPEIKAIADDTYKFLVSHFYDASTKQFQLKVSENGFSVVDSNKILYGEGFAIYGLSTYGRVFKIPEATTYALETFRAIDARHDATNLGYDEHNDSTWLQSGAMKSTNTHIHLMEAFTALYEATQDATVKARLEELVIVVRTKILQQDKKYDAKEFSNDWKPFGNVLVSYGHDLETTWLLTEAARVLGKPDDPDIKSAMLVMGTGAAQRGFDASMGGYFEEGVPGGSPTSTDKIWWVESEALAGNFWLYRLTGDTMYLDRLESTLKFIEDHQRDNQNPGTEWFWGITKDGQINSRGDHKGEEWKASYHNSRALTFTEKWISDLVK
jgi:mannobiose 2-epimerase